MSRAYWLSVLLIVMVFSVPAAVKAFSSDTGKGLLCSDNDNPVCELYQVCKPILDQYPESEVTAAGKDCTLTIENRQLIIRRKRLESGVGYFFYFKTLPARQPGLSK